MGSPTVSHCVPRCPTMKVLVSLLLAVSPSSPGLGLGSIQKVSLRPSECNNCGMTALGQLNLKICGGSLPERCCSIVNLANYDNINEGIIYDYMGEHELEDCWNYSLQGVDSIDQFRLTVYHEGSDGGQLDYVRVTTTQQTVNCNLGYWLDGYDSVVATDCSFMALDG